MNQFTAIQGCRIWSLDVREGLGSQDSGQGSPGRLRPVALLVPPEEDFAEVPADGAQVHEVAIPSTCAGVLLVLPAGGLPEISDGGKLHLDWAPLVEAPCQTLRRKSAHRKWGSSHIGNVECGAEAYALAFWAHVATRECSAQSVPFKGLWLMCRCLSFFEHT